MATVTLYFVGETKDEAIAGLVFDSSDSAEEYINDQGEDATEYLNVYYVDVVVNATDLTQG